jgi:hypothetical protein
MKRRDAIIGVVASAIVGVLGEGVFEMMRVDGTILDDEEKEIAKDAMASFIGMHPDPAIEDVAERGRLAVRAWRLLNKN